MKTSRSLIIATVLLSLSVFAAAPVLADEGRIITVQTRPGVSVSFYYLKQDKARATVVLLPGGKGDLRLDDGAPDSSDFLVRSHEYFFANGLNVAIVDKPDDADELNFLARTSSQHIEDIRQIAAYVKEDSGLPVWLIGTSRGTISAALAAIAMPPDTLNGIVLTSSITAASIPGAIPSLNLSKIHIPVLVVHHEDDRCEICDPNDVPKILEKLYNSPVKKAVFVKGGGWTRGGVCGPRHRHGYIGIEEKVVALISEWIKNPAF